MLPWIIVLIILLPLIRAEKEAAAAAVVEKKREEAKKRAAELKEVEEEQRQKAELKVKREEELEGLKMLRQKEAQELMDSEKTANQARMGKREQVKELNKDDDEGKQSPGKGNKAIGLKVEIAAEDELSDDWDKRYVPHKL